jgi:hypothetical protein
MMMNMEKNRVKTLRKFQVNLLNLDELNEFREEHQKQKILEKSAKHIGAKSRAWR